ncbi:MAG TPA: ribonuclease HII [Bacteroidota bacterium]|nr:ribonuclease HII [Bacteroidota bacterium]
MKRLECCFERVRWASGIRRVAGIDEAGRGPLAGPVVAAAVVFPEEVWIQGVDDSKVLDAATRERLFDVIMGCAEDVGVGIASHTEIDALDIYRATIKAMHDAVALLKQPPGHLLVDGPRFGHSTIPSTPIVGGDARCFAIAAASIVAKVTRDRIMVEYGRLYPEYGFPRHKGYGTAAHMDAIRKYGPCPIHRTSFRLPSRENGGT